MSRLLDPTTGATVPVTVRLTPPQLRALGSTPADRRIRLRELVDALVPREVPPCAR